jgi:HPt (histidine-containing phosphotransfer) domain-containing protein
VTEPAIDRAAFDRLVEMTGGEMDFVDDLVDTYLQDGAAQVAALEAAVAAGGGPDDLVRPAHSLKSSSLNVGAVGLGGVCRELEEAARSGLVPDAAERVAAIAAGFDEARHELLAERERRASA